MLGAVLWPSEAEQPEYDYSQYDFIHNSNMSHVQEGWWQCRS